jgi:hypothetical protein
VPEVVLLMQMVLAWVLLCLLGLVFVMPLVSLYLVATVLVRLMLLGLALVLLFPLDLVTVRYLV